MRIFGIDGYNIYNCKSKKVVENYDSNQSTVSGSLMGPSGNTNNINAGSKKKESFISNFL